MEGLGLHPDALFKIEEVSKPEICRILSLRMNNKNLSLAETTKFVKMKTAPFAWQVSGPRILASGF
jgi:hypothetical protein